MQATGDFDVFNGDADGIIARHQYRLGNPCASTLVTGVKRDIALLERLRNNSRVCAGNRLFVFDISFDVNHDAASALLARAVEITWFDHHRAAKLVRHRHLISNIDTAAERCTSLIVDDFLGRAYHHWAIAAAYGDNLVALADRLANQAGMSAGQRDVLQQLGELINYNAYGECVDDLHIAPAILAANMAPYTSPFDFIAGDAAFKTLAGGYADDIARTASIKPEFIDDHVAAFVLPDAAWARRISGTFANQCALGSADRAHVIATCNRSGAYAVSIRAPINNPRFADEVAIAFGGGGRKAAAGIDHLAANELAAVIQKMRSVYTNS